MLAGSYNIGHSHYIMIQQSDDILLKNHSVKQSYTCEQNQSRYEHTYTFYCYLNPHTIDHSNITSSMVANILVTSIKFTNLIKVILGENLKATDRLIYIFVLNIYTRF